MSFDNTKYHVEINTVPYLIKGYQKSELNTFIPRLSAGEQDQTDFDLLKSASVGGFGGGMLQRFWDDPTSVFAVENMFPVYDDGALYPVNAPVADDGVISGSKAVATAFCSTVDYLFVASVTFNTPTPRIVRIDSSGTEVVLTLPASLTSSSRITSMVVKGGYLYISTGYDNLWNMDIASSTTVVAITGGSATQFSQMIVFNGQLYGTTGQNVNNDLYRYTGTHTSASLTLVGSTGQSLTDSNARLVKYNNRIILSRRDGLYAYDGIKLVEIESKSDSVDLKNYRFPTILKGYYYYFMPDGMYRFNGSLIEKLYDVSEIGTPIDMFAGKNRLWIFFRNSSVFSSRYDKAMGYDYSTGDVMDGTVKCFDGKGLFTYSRIPNYTKNPGSDDVVDQGAIDRGYWFADKIYVFLYYEKNTVNLSYTISTAETTSSGNKVWRLIPSIYDGGFPMVDKNLDNIEMILDGNISADQDITIEYRTTGFDGSTGWTSLGTIKTQTRLKEYIFRANASGVTFKKIQFRFSGTTASTYGIAKIVLRTLLAPDLKWQWLMTVNCYGDEALAPLQLTDDTDSTQTVRALRGNIYSAKMSDVPIKFLDVDQLDLNGAHTNSVTTITLNSTSLLKEFGFIQIDDEIIYYTAKTSTTLTGCIRAMLGTSASSHSDNAKVFPVYRAIIRSIQNERIELTNPSVTEDKSRASEITLVMQEV